MCLVNTRKKNKNKIGGRQKNSMQIEATHIPGPTHPASPYVMRGFSNEFRTLRATATAPLFSCRLCLFSSSLSTVIAISLLVLLPRLYTTRLCRMNRRRALCVLFWLMYECYACIYWVLLGMYYKLWRVCITQTKEARPGVTFVRSALNVTLRQLFLLILHPEKRFISNK